jgi:hypothetical protein
MLISSSLPGFPTRAMLQRFFRAGRSTLIPLADAAALLGMTSDQVSAIVEREGMVFRGGMLSWEEVAHQLFLAWPRVELLDMLGADAQDRIPTLFFPMPLQLHLPLYLHLAMKHQAQRAREEDLRAAREIHDYVADLLHVAVDDGTLHAFRDNAPFLEAFHYPTLPSEAGA